MSQVTFYLVRHGQTELNRKRRIQGVTNSPLTAKGKRRAEKLGQKLANVKFAAAYTSDLLRTKTTAQLILEQNHCWQPPIYCEPALREYDFGRFESLPNWKMIPWAWKILGARQVIKAMTTEQHVGELTELVRQLNGTEQAETADQLAARMRRCLAQIAGEYDHDVNLLIVTHGLLLANFLESLGVDVPLFLLGNSKVSKVSYAAGKFKVVYVNQKAKEVKLDD